MSALSPAVALCLVFVVSWGLFLLAKRFQTKKVFEKEKREIYFCGEPYEPVKGKAEKGELHPEYRRFFATAFLFTVMEIGALFLGTIPKGLGIFLPLGFLGLMLVSVGAILVEVFEER